MIGEAKTVEPFSVFSPLSSSTCSATEAFGTCFASRRHMTLTEWNETCYIYIYTYIYIYLDNPPVQNYRSKSETAINIAGCLNFRRFQFFSPFQFPQFRLLMFFAVSSGFFAVSLGFFAVSKPANACKMTNIQKLFGGRKTCRQQ